MASEKVDIFCNGLIMIFEKQGTFFPGVEMNKVAFPILI